MPPMKTGVAHSENFPVASWLCPAHLRPVIGSIYWFARTADDLADEGTATAAQRLADLACYRAQLEWAAQLASSAAPTTPASPAFDPRWQAIFQPLTAHIRTHALPVHLLHDLLSAFELDVRRTASGQHCANHAELVDYCRLSANPVGRLLLHLYGVTGAERLQESDCICTALQLINFWQDLSEDIPRQRHYLPLAELAAHGLSPADFAPPATGRTGAAGAATQAQTEADSRLESKKEQFIANLLCTASASMQKGSELPLHIPGRAGWELRLVVQGGLRMADKIAQLQHRTWQTRPTLSAADLPVLLWRAWRMGWRHKG